MYYRPEIDGLRAFAILAVIFFHADFSWMSGGFLGVDVFFVISGYLITSIIINEQTQQRFRLLHFYERRIRRILPALFFVLCSSLVAAWFIFSPLQLVNFADSFMATMSFAANIYFWQHIDYFTGDTNLLPLLHLWSLGVEEQFYFVLPLLLLALSHRPQRWLWVILTALFILSLGSAQWLSTSHPNAAFYLLPTRAWELLAGAGCAIYLQQKSHSPARHWAQLHSALGIGLLLLSFFFFTPLTQHPSGWTVAPVLGTVLLILYANPQTYVARFLSVRPLVWIGLLSYSAYLWHQPLFAFTRHLTLQPELRLSTTLGLIALTFILSAFSWRFVEQPFRNRAFLSSKQVYGIAAFVLLLSLLLMAALQHYKGFPQRFNRVEQILLAYQDQALRQHQTHDPCFLQHDEDSSHLGADCRINAQTQVAVLGDSHASALWYGLVKQLPAAKYTASGCAPFVGEQLSNWWPFCPGVNAFNFNDVAQTQPPVVLLHANWLLREKRLQSGEENIIGATLGQTVEYLQEIAPNSRIVVVGDVPQWQPSLITLLRQHSRSDLSTPWLPNASYTTSRAVEEKLRAHLPPNVTFISLLDALCKPDGTCRALVPVGDEWEPLAWDYGHLSRGGSDFVAQYILPWLTPTATEAH